MQVQNWQAASPTGVTDRLYIMYLLFLCHSVLNALRLNVHCLCVGKLHGGHRSSPRGHSMHAYHFHR